MLKSIYFILIINISIPYNSLKFLIKIFKNKKIFKIQLACGRYRVFQKVGPQNSKSSNSLNLENFGKLFKL